MSNYFDKFDQPETQNFFDQFDPIEESPVGAFENAYQGGKGLLLSAAKGLTGLMKSGGQAIERRHGLNPGGSSNLSEQEAQIHDETVARNDLAVAALRGAAQEGIDNATAEQAKFEFGQESYEDVHDISSAAQYVGERIVTSLPYMAASVIPGGALVMGAGLSQQAYDAQPEDKKDPARAVVSGFGQSYLEKLGTLSSVGRMATPKKGLMKIPAAAMGEGLTETGQEVLSRWGAGNDLDDANTYRDLDEAFVGGAAVGGTVRGVTAGVDKVADGLFSNAFDKLTGQADARRQQVAEQGGDALEQTLAASEEYTQLGEAVKTLNALNTIAGQTAQDWQPNWVMPDEAQQPVIQDGEFLGPEVNSVPLGQQLEFDPAINSLEPDPFPQIGNTIHAPDMRESQADIEQEPAQAIPEGVRVKPNNEPYQTEKSMLISKSYRDALNNGLNPQAIEVPGGYGFTTSSIVDNAADPSVPVQQEVKPQEIETPESSMFDVSEAINAPVIGTAQTEILERPDSTRVDLIESEGTLTNLQQYDNLWERVEKGDEALSVNELRTQFELLKSQENQVKEELSKLTKDELIRKYYNGYRDNTMRKSDLVEASYDDIMKSYRYLATKNDFITETIDPFAKRDPAMRFSSVERDLNSLTDESLQDVIQTRKAKNDEALAKRDQKIEGMKSPKTLEDFRNATRYGLSSKFTNDQWLEYDRLHANDRLEKLTQRNTRKVEAFDGDAKYTLNQTTHSQKGHELFIVSLDERLDREQYRELNTKAKALGGYYSSYSKQGAIPGFQFKTEESRQEFLKVINGDDVEKTKERKDKTDTLIEVADRLEAKANESLNQDRKTNTARRAGMAAGAIANAENDLHVASELKTIATAIKDGKTKYLSNLKTKTERDLIASLWNDLFYKAKRDKGTRENLIEEDGRGDWGKNYKWKADVSTSDKVRLAEYPLTSMSEHQLSEISKGMLNTKGYALAGKAFAKLADKAANSKQKVYVKDNKYFDKMIEFVRRHSDREYIQEVAKDFQRLQRMGIESLPMLRAALAEYDQIKSTVKVEKTNNATTEKLKYAELMGKHKDSDFFNSTKVVVDQVLEYANLDKGMKVLEPSAGVGHLADGAASVVGKSNVDTGELKHELQGFLKDKGYNVSGGDFLERAPEPIYDSVIMNPPFSKDQEITHVEHAYKFLKPGGRLVAVTSNMAGQRSNRRNQDFRNWLDELGAEEVNLPEGAFKDAINPTSVNAKIIIIDKPTESPLFNKTDKKVLGKGVPLEKAQQMHDDFIKQFKGLDDGIYQAVVTNKNPSDFFGEKAADLNRSIKGGFDPGRNRGYFFAQNHKSEADLRATINEELLVHKGLGIYSESEVNELLSSISDTRNSKSKKIQSIWDNIDRNYDGETDLVKAEEFLGKVSHEQLNVPDKYFRKVVSTIQSILQKLGIVKDSITYSQMRNEVYKIADALKRGETARRDLSGTSRQNHVFLRTEHGKKIQLNDEGRFERYQRKFQDRFNRVKATQKAVEEAGGDINNDTDTYLAEELYYGKTEEDLRVIEDEFFKPLEKKLAESDIEREELDLFLYAKHAEERNKHIASKREDMPDGGSGMKTAEANRILAQFESEGKAAKLEEVAELVYSMTNRRQNLLKEAGLSNDIKDFDGVEDSNFEYYVPLKGFAHDPEGEQKARTGQGFSIRGREDMRAMGRRTMAESPTLHAMQDLSASAIRARKNEVGQTFLKMVEENPEPAMWQVFTDKSPDTQKVEVDGKIVDRPVSMKRHQDYFAVKRGGTQHYIKISDTRLREALQNTGAEAQQSMINGIGKYTRWLAKVNTSLNPVFMATNFVRDLQTAYLNAKAEQSIEGGKIKGADIAGKMVKGTPAAILTVRDFYRDGKLRTDAEKERMRYFKEFLADGAKTGYFDSKTVEQIAKEMANNLDIEKGSLKGKALKVRKNISDFIEHYNTAVENGVRLSAYIEARKSGVDRKQASSFAKNLTVNFNRKGELSNGLNSLFMFFNASVQGTANFSRTMVTPKSGDISDWKSLNRLREAGLSDAQKVAGGIMGSAFALALLNREAAGEDEDGVNYYDKVPSYVRERNLVVMKSLLGIGEPGEYFTFPLPYGYNIFYNMGDAAEAFAQSDFNKRKAAIPIEFVKALATSFTPFGVHGSDSVFDSALFAASPSVLLPIAEIATNTNHFGGRIYRENYDHGPQKAEANLAMRSTKEPYKHLASWLNEFTGGSEYQEGLINISPDKLEHMMEFGLGGLYRTGDRTIDTITKRIQGSEVEASEHPLRRVVEGEVKHYEDVQQFYEARQEIIDINAELKTLRGEERKAFLKEFNPKRMLRTKMERIYDRLRTLNKRRDRIESDDTLSEAEKEKRLDAIEEKKASLVMQFNKRWYQVE